MSQKTKEETYPEGIIEIMERCFPKGDKKRGDALLLQAVAYSCGKGAGKQKAPAIKSEIEFLEKLDVNERGVIPKIKERLLKLKEQK